MRVRLSAQVVEFVRSQAPEPRRRLRSALRALTREQGDLKPLEGPLQDYHRLRIGSYRVILRYKSSGSSARRISSSGNCISSVTAFAVRARRVNGRRSMFFGLDTWTEDNSQ